MLIFGQGVETDGVNRLLPFVLEGLHKENARLP